MGTFLAPRLWSVYERVTHAAGAALGRPARLVQGESFSQLTRGELDAAFVCGLPYVALREQFGSAVEALAAPVMAGERYGDRPVYFSDVLVRADAPAARLQDLAGGRLGVNEPESHSGYGVVLAALADRGVPEGGFAEVVATGSHARSLEGLRAGRIDVAAVDSHLLAALGADDPRLGEHLRVVEPLGPSPAQPLTAGPALSEQERVLVREALREVERTDLAPGVSFARWEPVDDADYDPIRRMRAAGAARAGF